MEYGLGKILAVKKLPQMKNLEVTDSTRFVEVYQLLTTGNIVTVVNKKGKVLRSIDRTNSTQGLIDALRETVRYLIKSYKEEHIFDRWLLIEVVTAEEYDFSSLDRETTLADFVVTKITAEESAELMGITTWEDWYTL